MKKAILLLVSIVLLITAVPVFAAKPAGENGNTGNGTSNNKPEKSQDTHGLSAVGKEEDSVSPRQAQTTSEDTNEDSETNSSVTPTLSIPSNQDVSSDPEDTPTATPTIICDLDKEWKNHGEYVSCVAKTHPGGKTVSEAARSDIGKKHFKEEVTPSATPTPTLSITPTETPPVTSSLLKADEGFAPLRNFGKLFERFFGFFKHLL